MERARSHTLTYARIRNIIQLLTFHSSALQFNPSMSAGETVAGGGATTTVAPLCLPLLAWICSSSNHEIFHTADSHCGRRWQRRWWWCAYVFFLFLFVICAAASVNSFRSVCFVTQSNLQLWRVYAERAPATEPPRRTLTVEWNIRLWIEILSVEKGKRGAYFFKAANKNQ